MKVKNVPYVNPATFLISALLSLVLAGCGKGGGGGAGGSGSSGAAALSPTLNGVAATGAPLSNAAMTLTCGDASTKTATAADNGSYSFPLTACAPPFVITATGLVNDSQETLCSVEANALSFSTVTANTTPLTNALCALLSSTGDPLELAANYATEKAKLTDIAVQDRKDAIVGAIGKVLVAAGVGARFDIVNTAFSANRSGVDLVLDNIKVEVTAGGVNLVNMGAGIVDDMGNNPAAQPTNLSAATVSLTRSSPADTVARLPGVIQDNSVADAARDLLNACFALPADSRGTFDALGDVCASLPLSPDYKHDGRSGAQEFDRFLTNGVYDGAVFSKPEVVRFFSATATDKRAQVKLGLKRSDGVIESLVTVAENSASTNNKWMLRGNQRAFRVFVNGTAQRRVQIADRGSPTSAKSTFYVTGLNVYVDFSAGDAKTLLAHAKVTGPGLPTGGLFVNPKLPGCDQYFAIAANSGATPATCTSIFRLSSRGVTAADPDNEAASFGATAFHPAVKVTDEQILAIQPFSAYRFELFNVGNGGPNADFVYIERLRSRPYTMGTVTSPGASPGEVDLIHWNAGLSSDTIHSITPGSAGTFTGGPEFTVAWQNLPNAPPIGFLNVQTKPATTLFQESAFVPFSATTLALKNGGVAWPSMAASTGAGNFNFVQLGAVNKYGTQILHDWKY